MIKPPQERGGKRRSGDGAGGKECTFVKDSESFTTALSINTPGAIRVALDSRSGPIGARDAVSIEKDALRAGLGEFGRGVAEIFPGHFFQHWMILGVEMQLFSIRQEEANGDGAETVCPVKHCKRSNDITQLIRAAFEILVVAVEIMVRSRLEILDLVGISLVVTERPN